MKYKCIIFDCDGVLVDSEAISTAVLIEMATEIGVEINAEYVDDNFSGKSLKSAFEDIEQRLGSQLPKHFEKAYRARTFTAFKRDLKPVAGIHEVINQLELPFCVASSGPVEKIRLNLATTQLLHHFEGRIFSSYEIGSWKPAPGIFQHAATKMGFEPQECAVIEDSIAGVQAAISGDFDVYGFGSLKNQTALKKAGAKVFFEMRELLDVLKVSGLSN